jgi:tetratricopeptide (TPR) repeat protein
MKIFIITCFINLGISAIYSHQCLSSQISISGIHDSQTYHTKDKYSVAQNKEAIISNNANFYYDRGIQKIRFSDRKGAIVDFDTAIKINPKYADAYFQRGNLKFVLSEDDDKRRNGTLVEIGDRRPAILDLNKAISLRTNNLLEAYQVRCSAKAFMGYTNAAISDCNEGAELFRRRGDVESYRTLKDWAGLIKINVVCLATCPNTSRH